MRLARTFVLGLALAACDGGASNAPAEPPPSAEHPLLGQTLPSVERRTLDGKTVQLGGAHPAGPTVVKFFAEYCEPCKRTLPEAQALSVAHPEVQFIGISEDDRASKAQALVNAYGLTFPVVHDNSNVLAGRFRVSTMPVTFLVDRSGVVQWVGGPQHTEHDLRAAVQQLAGG